MVINCGYNLLILLFKFSTVSTHFFIRIIAAFVLLRFLFGCHYCCFKKLPFSYEIRGRMNSFNFSNSVSNTYELGFIQELKLSCRYDGSTEVSTKTYEYHRNYTEGSKL